MENKVRILSTSPKPFLDRYEAGRMLAKELASYRGLRPVVLGIPRGGMVIADVIARELEGELDIVLAHKLRTPGQGELAMGSVSENGDVILNEEIVRELNIGEEQINREKAEQMEEIARRVKLFRAIRPRVPLRDRIVIITDDGVATGATTQAAIRSVRAEKPARLILAVPVGSADTLQKLAEDLDELICLKSPLGLSAVGQVYVNFNPVTDDEVNDILRNGR